MALKSFSYYDLIDAFAEPGCPICRLLRRDVSRLLDSILYEYATDRAMQSRFRASRGLCATHGRQLSRNQNALAIAVLYEQSLHELVEILAGMSPGQPAVGVGRLFASAGGGPQASQLEPRRACIACETRADREAGHLRALADGLGDEKLLDAYRASDGLCAAHFRQSLGAVRVPGRRQSLVAIQRDIWTRLLGELNEFMRKSDSNHAGEAMGTESNSWLRAVRIVSGELDDSV